MSEQRNNQENNDYTFLQEKIKERPVNKRKVFKQSVLTVSLAVVFALVTCFVFFFVQNAAIKKKARESTPTHDIQVDLQETDEEILPEDLIQIDLDEDEENDESEPKQNTVIKEVTVTHDLDIADYQALCNKMKSLSSVASKSLVCVTGIKDGQTWLQNSYETTIDTTGIIVGDNGTDLIILVPSYAIADVIDIRIKFCNSQTVSAHLNSIDESVSLATLSVPLTAILDPTKESISYAALGNSATGAKSGDLVFAIGDPYGFGSSVAYGMITSNNTEINGLDRNYSLITTDIYGSHNANGVLINSKGNIIGIIDQSHNRPEFSNLISAIGMTELAPVIENLCNNTPGAHLGVYVTNVTNEARIIYGIPLGAYILNIDLDSPAMDGGIHKGDVITGIDDVVISSVNDFINELANHKPGDEIKVSLMRANGDSFISLDVTVILTE